MNNPNVNNDYYNNIANNYSASLSNEIAELQRKIYLPLLPLERLTSTVLATYEKLGKYYWFKEDVYEAKTGNFYIPVLFPLEENGDSTDIVHAAPNTRNTLNSDKLATSDYVTRNYINLTIPRHIVMQFSNLIPAGTKFNVSFTGGSSSNQSIKVLSVAETVAIPHGEWNDSTYNTIGMSTEAIEKLIKDNLDKIEKEEERRRKEEAKYANRKDS